MFLLFIGKTMTVLKIVFPKRFAWAVKNIALRVVLFMLQTTNRRIGR